jgi:hypothetical protein
MAGYSKDKQTADREFAEDYQSIIFVVRHNGIERKFATVQERDALVDAIYASDGAYPVFGFLVK